MRALAITMLVACGSPAKTPVDAAAADATDAPIADSPGPQLEMLYRTRDGMSASCAAGTAVPLTFPPQGGFVLLVGARVKHFDLSSVTVTASIRDSIDDHVVSLVQQPVMLVPDTDGWAVPDQPMNLFNWANLPACPAEMATQDIFDRPYVLRIAGADGAGATAEQKVSIVPSCEAGSAGDPCRCQCKLGYKLGDPCP